MIAIHTWLGVPKAFGFDGGLIPMRDFEPAPEEPRFCHLSGRLNGANKYLFAATAVVSRIHEEDVGREAKYTLIMLLSEIGERIDDAIKIKEQLMELHAPDQIIPGKEDQLYTFLQWQDRVKREGLPF